MKQTRKFKAAIACPATLDLAAQDVAAWENAQLYDALEKNGWFWDAETGEWAHYKPRTSMFVAQENGDLPSDDCRLRLMAHPQVMNRFIEIIQEALDSYAIQIMEVSNKYPNRRGVGERVYMTVHLPPEPTKRRDGAQ